MQDFGPKVDAAWIEPFSSGSTLVDLPGLRVGIAEEAAPEFPAQILELPGQVLALVSQDLSTDPLVHNARNEPDLRRALTSAGLAMNGADQLFFLSPQALEMLRSDPAAHDVRQLRSDDRDLFDDFTARAPEADLDEAYVELEHWAVFGAFHDGQLAAIGSAYPFSRNESMADIGVITLPDFRGRGFARKVVQAISLHIAEHGLEPQYRCQLDNESSLILAARCGFSPFGTWDVALPE